MNSEIIEKLKVLQSILSEVFRIETEMEKLPKNMNTRQRLLDRMKKLYIDKNVECDAVKEQIAKTKEALYQAEREREQREQRMEEIKTQREYEALDKEIQDATAQERQFRKDIQRNEQHLEEMQTELNNEELLMRSQEVELDEETEKIEKETQKRLKILDKLKQKERDLTPSLDEELLFKFNRIIRITESEGIVALKGGVCSGCQMILPNQFVNDLRGGTDIYFCPYCSKVVFYVDDDEGQENIGNLADMVQTFDDTFAGEIDLSDVFEETPLELGVDEETDDEIDDNDTEKNDDDDDDEDEYNDEDTEDEYDDIEDDEEFDESLDSDNNDENIIE